MLFGLNHIQTSRKQYQKLTGFLKRDFNEGHGPKDVRADEVQSDEGSILFEWSHELLFNQATSITQR